MSSSPSLRVLVTGSAGHLGEALVRELGSAGHEVVGVDVLDSAYTTAVGSIVDRAFVRRSMEGVDAVIHAATPHKPHVETHTRQHFGTRTSPARSTCSRRRLPVALGASCSPARPASFGRALTPPAGAPAAWITEDVAPVPRNIYGMTKTVAEDLCRLFHQDHGLPCLILRTSRFFPEEDDRKEVREAYDDGNVKASENLYRRVDIHNQGGPMEYRILGSTGVTVSTHCLGAMMFGEWGNTDVDECVRIVYASIDDGVNFIDTADMYSAGQSEEIVGRALKDRRDDVVLATKVHMEMGPGKNQRGNSRVWIMREVEDSLRRLGTDHIDLYQIHRPEPETDVEETLGALTDLQRQGKIRYFGSSTFPGWQMVEAQWTAERRGLSRFRTEQPPYSIFVRHVEQDVLPVAERYGMGVLVWSPLCRGWLTGRYRRNDFDESSQARAARGKERGGPIAAQFDLSRAENQRKLDLVEALAKLAADAGISMTHMAVAFTLAHPAVTSAIIGPRTMEQLQDMVAGADVRLDAATLDAIDELVAPGTVVDENDRGFSPWWLKTSARRRRR